MNRIVLLAALLLPEAASAHALLESAVPAVGSVVRAAPDTLALTFSEAVEPRFTKVVVTDQAGANATAGPVRTDPSDAHGLLVPVRALPAGRVTVVWHAVSVDTHRTEGTYRFTIQP